jgi:Flp pilus assembly protein TadB
MFLSVSVAVMFSFIAVTVWAGERRKEREAYYRSEVIKKFDESATPGAALEFLRETQRISARSLRGGLRLAGLIVFAAGIGLMMFLSAVHGPPYQVGLIPLLVGAALFVYGQFLAPRD